jgi:hypothetical protein
MSTLAGVANGLQAALLLARGKPDGIGLLATAEGEPAMANAARSFWAAALCLPAFVCLQLIDLAQEPRLPPHAAHGFALQLLGYAIDWAGFALLTRWLARTLGRGGRWPVFIAAWNWCNVVQYLLLVVASLPPLLGMPDIVGETAWLVATGWALWLEWYATRLALDISRMQAIGLVLLDEALGFGLLAVIQTLPGGGM